MSHKRITVTVPPDLVKHADRLARRHGASRSAIISEALHDYVTRSQGLSVRGSRVSESRLGYEHESPTLRQASNQTLIAELQRRLGERARGALTDSEIGAKPGYDRSELTALCRRHRIRRLSLFGSALTADFGPESDLDVLVEFEPGHTPGLAITDIEDELSALVGGRHRMAGRRHRGSVDLSLRRPSHGSADP